MLSRKMEQATSVSSCSRKHARAPDETGMEQVLSDLRALKGLYGLLHMGQANENLDEASRALLMRMLDDATRQALLRQAQMLSYPLMSPTLERKLSIQTRGGADQRLKPVASPSLSLHGSEISGRLNLQSSVRSRDSHRVDDHRRAKDNDHLLGRVASNRSSRTAMPQHHLKPEQRIARLGSHRSSRAAKLLRGTVNGSAPRADRRDGHDRPHRGSGRGYQSSLERSSRRRSVSREPSTRGKVRLHGRAAARLVGAENGSSRRRFGRLGSGLSVAVMSRRGSERSRRGAATPRRSWSSNDGTVTIRSRIRPNRELMERCLCGAEEESPPRRRGKDGAAGSASVGWSGWPRRTLNRIDSGSTYSSRSSPGAASPSPSTSPTVPSSSGAPASCSSSSVLVSRRGSARPEYAFEVSSASRSRRRRERQDRRDGRLGRFKNKLALVFHHRHDHHHHHHHHIGRGRSGSQAQEGPSRRDRRANHGKSPWRYLGGMFHRSTGHDEEKKSTSRTVVTVPAKRCGGGHVHSLFDALVRHKWGARRAPATAPKRAGMRRTVNRVQVKKMHWWQRPRQRRSRGRPRRRLGQG